MLPTTPRTERRLNGGTVRRLRKAYGITQDVLATRTDVHFAYLSNLESGKKQPSLAVMVRLAAALEVDLDDISYLTAVYVIADDESAKATA